METCAKEMKLAEPTTDPFEMIPVPLIHDQILQHVTGKEVKDLFQVCQEWNKIVSRSNSSMKKFQFMEDLTSPEKIEGLLKSQRRYSDLFCFIFDSNIQGKMLLFMLLLEKFSLSLVKLEITILPRDFYGSAPRKLQFPKLKKLTLRSWSHELLPAIEINSLITFEFQSDDLSCVRAESISDFLKKQPHLKRLKITCSMPFALKELSLVFYSEMSPTARLNLYSSLRNMSDSLKTFQISKFTPEVVQLVVNELPSLKV